MVQLSGNLLFIAFILYLIGVFLFSGSIRDKRAKTSVDRWARYGIIVTIVGFASQIGYFITRWIAAGHAPVSNLFEFTTFFGMMLVGAFIVMYFVYRMSVLGIFTLPIAMLIIAYASMFPRDIQPLIPSLKSNWLKIHVTTAAAGEAILSISFAAGLIYLIRSVNQNISSKSTLWLEIILYCLISTLGFVTVSSVFAVTKYETQFSWVDKAGEAVKEPMKYNMPALVIPNEGKIIEGSTFQVSLEMPGIVNAKKMNTLLWSLGAGLLLYGLARIILRKRIAAFIQPFLKNVNLELTDEICYRAVTIGFPVFTLGGIIFAMFWAQVAWGRFWGWDPKEVWALITWLFYAVFLHLRLSEGWHGEKSAWLASIGFGITMFNLVAVNLVIAGLHSYA